MLGVATPAIDNAAHIGGVLGGFFAALMLAEVFDPMHFKKYGTLRLAATILVATITLASLWGFISLHKA